MADFPQGPAQGNQPQWPVQGPPPGFSAPAAASRVPTYIAIALALAALAVAIASWFRPAPEPVEAAPAFTETEIADAKKNVCDAYRLAFDAFVATTSRPRGTDDTSILAIAAQTRIAGIGGSQYLLNVLSANPATPPDLARTVKDYASSYQQLALSLLADKGQADMDQSVLTMGDTANEKLKQECL
jgi:hypothetical protein